MVLKIVMEIIVGLRNIKDYGCSTPYSIARKAGYVLPEFIWSEFRLGQYGDDDHREDAPHFM